MVAAGVAAAVVLLGSSEDDIDFQFSSRADDVLQPLWANRAPMGPPATWTGADVATSVALPRERRGGPARHLWLFGDTLVGVVSSNGDRNISVPGGGFARNSAAVLSGSFGGRNNSGAVPHRDNVTFSWNRDRFGHADSEFKPQHYVASSHWYWVVSGIINPLSGSLFLLAQDVVSSSSGLGFAGIGTGVIYVPDPSLPVGDWDYSVSTMIRDSAGKLDFSDSVAIGRGDLGGAAGAPSDNTTVYFMGTNDYTSDRTTALARMSLSDLESKAWHNMEFLVSGAGLGEADGDAADDDAVSENGHWVRGPLTNATKSNLAAVMPMAGEATLQWHPFMKRWFRIYVAGFGATSIDIWVARQITGPWSRAPLYDIPAPFDDTDKYFCYAAKSHPELTTNENEIVFTYATNAKDVGDLTTNDEVYIPRFVRTTIHKT